MFSCQVAATGLWIIRYHKLRKSFSKFYRRHSELIVKYNVGLKPLLQQGILETVFYSDLVYKFKIILGKPSFNDQFNKSTSIIKEWDRAWMLCESLHAWFSYGFLFNCTMVGQALDSMMTLT